MSIEQFVAAYHAGNDYYVEPKDNHRLWVHDMLHAVLQLSTQSAAGEEAVSIYQAVLLRDPRVDSNLLTHEDFGQTITLECVRNIVIPKVQKFLRKLGVRAGFVPANFLSSDEIADHFDRAQRLAYAFLDLTHDKRPFGQITVVELKQIPVKTYLNLAAKRDAHRTLLVSVVPRLDM